MRVGEFSALRWEDIDFSSQTIRICRSFSSGYVNGKKIELITTPKTPSGYREIPFFGNVEQHLLNWKKKQEARKKACGERWRGNPQYGNLVWTNTMGSILAESTLRSDIRTVEQKMERASFEEAIRLKQEPCGFTHVYPHCFRHTFATRLFEAGLPGPYVQRILGHSSYDTTLAYTHITKENAAQQLRKANMVFRNI